jgi:hypothetical protein
MGWIKRKQDEDDPDFKALSIWADEVIKQGVPRSRPLFVVYQHGRFGQQMFVQVFLTKKSADEFLGKHGPRLVEPYILVESAADNPELTFLVDLLLRLAGKGDKAWHR